MRMRRKPLLKSDSEEGGIIIIAGAHIASTMDEDEVKAISSAICSAVVSAFSEVLNSSRSRSSPAASNSSSSPLLQLLVVLLQHQLCHLEGESGGFCMPIYTGRGVGCLLER